MKYKNYIEKIIKEIIDSYDNSKLFSELDNIIEIDFADIFPKSEMERKEISTFLNENAKLMEKDNKGEFYLLNDPVETKYGILEIVKLRIFDEHKKKRGTMDFKCNDYNSIKAIIKDRENVYIIHREFDELIEIPIQDNYIYISNKPKCENFIK